MIPLKGVFTKTAEPKIVEIGLEGCPARFCVATPEAPADAPLWQRGWGVASGRGLDRETALAATVAEAVERMSVWSRGPQDPLLAPRGHRGGRERADPNRFLHFDEDQLRSLGESRQAAGAEESWIPFADVDRFDMAFADLATGRARRVGVLAGLFGEELRLGWTRQISSSSGTAVRESLAAARETAVLELVERDAVALWWYNRLVPPRIPDALARERLPPPLAAYLAGRSRITRVLDLPTDLPATVVVAVSAEADGTWPSLGAAAALDPDAALTSAALEMLQGEVSLRLMENAQAMADPPPVPPFLAFSRATAVDAAPHLAGADDAVSPAGRSPFASRRPAAFDDLVDALVAGGIPVLVADVTRAEFGVPCARAISPVLRDWAPRFGPGRLFDVPVALGLLPRPPTVAELNPVPFVL